MDEAPKDTSRVCSAAPVISDLPQSLATSFRLSEHQIAPAFQDNLENSDADEKKGPEAKTNGRSKVGLHYNNRFNDAAHLNQ